MEMIQNISKIIKCKISYHEILNIDKKAKCKVIHLHIKEYVISGLAMCTLVDYMDKQKFRLEDIYTNDGLVLKFINLSK